MNDKLLTQGESSRYPNKLIYFWEAVGLAPKILFEILLDSE